MVLYALLKKEMSNFEFVSEYRLEATRAIHSPLYGFAVGQILQQITMKKPSGWVPDRCSDFLVCFFHQHIIFLYLAFLFSLCYTKKSISQ